MAKGPGRILIAGGGIAGLTAAIAFARQGFWVEIFERRATSDGIGAGLQLSPNATRVLGRLDLLPAIRDIAARPESVILRDAATLAELGRVPLGDDAEKRWHAPYLVAHRADIHAVLEKAAAQYPSIEIVRGAIARDIRIAPDAPAEIGFDSGAGSGTHSGDLLVGADGVWSAVRWLAGGAESRASGRIAWRRTMSRSAPEAAMFDGKSVEAFLHPGFHLVAYPMRGGDFINLVAFTMRLATEHSWSATGDPAILRRAMRRVDGRLLAVAADGTPWTTYPIHTVPRTEPWTRLARLALIGDAAHAMNPFAAQGAAMAIEDAESLAGAFAAAGGAGLAGWEKLRRARVDRVRRRGAFNRLVWHARGPMALGRNLVLKARRDEKLMADLDWLYRQ